MRFAEAHESLEEPLELPIRGKVYKIQPATAEDGIRLQEFLADMKDLHKKSKAGESVEDAAVKFHDSLDELEEVSLGKPVRDEMIADQLPLRLIEVAGMTAFYWQSMSDGGETARAYWESGEKNRSPTGPSAERRPRPNRARPLRPGNRPLGLVRSRRPPRRRARADVGADPHPVATRRTGSPPVVWH